MAHFKALSKLDFPVRVVLANNCTLTSGALIPDSLHTEFAVGCAIKNAYRNNITGTNLNHKWILTKRGSSRPCYTL
jgi:hypothetical protein